MAMPRCVTFYGSGYQAMDIRFRFGYNSSRIDMGVVYVG